MTHSADFAAVTMLYLADHSNFRVVTPQHPGLQAWSKTLRQLRFLLRDIETEPVAEHLRAALYGARLNCVISTIPFSHPLIWNHDKEQEVKELAQLVSASLPEVNAVVEENLRLLHLLQLFATNPIAQALEADLEIRRQLPKPRTWPGYEPHPQRWALVVRASLQNAMQEQWSHEPELAILTPQEMTGDRVFEQTYFLGAAQRYPAALIASPHALGATLYRYSFIFDEEIKRPLTGLIREHGHTAVPVEALPLLPEVAKVDWKPGRTMPGPVEAEESAVLEPTEDAPLIWRDEQEPESVGLPGHPPHVAEVASGQVREVTIATDRGPETLWLDEQLPTPRLHLGYPPSVEAVTGSTVQVGDVLLLRTEGTQLAYSRDLARSEFGAAYLRASTLLSEFKARVKQAVDEAGGRKQAVKLMIRVGADRTCTVDNLSQWYKLTNFRPDSEATYSALLNFIGWTERRSELDDAIKLLRASHIYAGRKAGEERLNLLLKLDFTRLQQHGYLEVELGGGKVGAHQVLQVAASSQPSTEAASSQVEPA